MDPDISTGSDELLRRLMIGTKASHINFLKR